MGSPSSSRRHQFQNHLPGFIFICRKMIPALILLALQSATVFGSSTCNRTCGFQQVPFPFGFSSGCEIPLNCTESDETMRIGEFPVYNITSDTIMVNFPQNCLRPIEAMKPLFSDNFAPDFNTAILLRNCSSPDLKCSIPSTMLKGLKCEVGNMSCFSYPHLKPGFIKYENLTRTGCNLVFSAISTVTADDTMSVSLDVQVVKLAWWLSGDCRCSNNAQCYQIWSPGEPRYRCQCMEGFTGDGYLYGSGCLRGKKHHRYLIPTAAASVAGFATFVILLFYFRRKYLCGYIWNLIRPKTNDEQILENFLANYGSLAPKRYSYSELRKMTESFRNQLGQGGFGCVYKGKMHNGSLVAVKVLKDLKEDGEGFINEVASISRTSHVNIVSLNGFCFDGRKRALVYEFMSNGSLEKFIYENKSSTRRQLGWKVLYNIAIGIARGLEYLHRGCNTRILHFDIKPHNILLDENFCPKISDFGLAKLCVNKESTVSIVGARGTIGYIAPEVVCRSIGGVSYKSDVYSYGMMVLEMVGGRKNVDVGVSRASEIYFPHWIHSRLELDEELELTGITNEEENEYARKMVIVSLWCIQMDPAIRPSMSKIVEMLEGNLSNLEIPPKPCFSSSSTSEVSYVRQSHNDTNPLTSDVA